jgi:hypothetical protein
MEAGFSRLGLAPAAKRIGLIVETQLAMQPMLAEHRAGALQQRRPPGGSALAEAGYQEFR